MKREKLTLTGKINVAVTVAIVAGALFAACTKQPPRPDAPVVQQVQALVANGAALACPLWIAPPEVPAALDAMRTIKTLALRDPSAAYARLVSDARLNQSIGVLWQTFHAVLPLFAETPAEWVALAEASIVVGLDGCSNALL